MGDSQELQDLKQQVNHYQTLYQKRVAKDLGITETSSQAVQTEDLPILTNQDKEILQKVQEFRTLVENSESHSLDRNQMNEIENLAEQITQDQVKIIANQVITDSAHVLGHRNLLKKIEDKENELEQVRQKINQQLRQINVLFDENAKNYETIDFNGLLSLLQKVKAEREREREQKVDDLSPAPVFSRKTKKKK